ncbi:AAA family ATPase [Luminiphilus sp.]|nr:AAA family ATPase [Luminiphilus sp.]
MNSIVRPHPWSVFTPSCPDVLEVPEFVLDNVLAAGTIVIAGQRGIGKTSALVPLMAIVTGLCSAVPLGASVRRKVIYVSEDTAQVHRILHGMRKGGHIKRTPAEINEVFKLVQASRLAPSEIVELKLHLEDHWLDNETASGRNYSAPPVIVLDTTNATIDIENISDNSQVSKAISELRNGLGETPLVLVGHMPKTSLGDVRQKSFVGAGSWEGDTQQNLYLIMEDDMRCLVIGKNRFSPEVIEYALHSHCTDMEGINKLGYPTKLRCWYSLPEAMSHERKMALKEKKAKQKRLDSDYKLMEDLLDAITENPGLPTTVVKSKVSGKGERKNAALIQLEQDGRVYVKKPDGRTRTYYPLTQF